MLTKRIPTAIVMANKANEFGMKRIFRTGGVSGIVPDKGADIVVRAHQGFRPGEVIIKDGHNKRRPVLLKSIKALEVNAQLAELIMSA